jgi:thiol-disulfide isomerase/thioredoxin
MITFLFLAAIQDKPVVIPKAELPKTDQFCTVCEADGNGHGAEKAVAGVRYQGKEYYFCHSNEVAKFTKDPEAYLPPILPRPMPAFALADTAGKTWNAEAMKGQLVLLDFWATWCVPCKEMKPVLERVQKQFGDKLTVLSVSIDEKRADFDKFLIKNKFSNPVLFDDKQTWAEWRVRVVPTFFLVKDGQIVGQWSGKKPEKDIVALVKKSQ